MFEVNEDDILINQLIGDDEEEKVEEDDFVFGDVETDIDDEDDDF